MGTWPADDLTANNYDQDTDSPLAARAELLALKQKIDAMLGAIASGATPWSDANDGPGSGLDADMLDGLQASDFLTPSDPGVPSTKGPSTAQSTSSGTLVNVTGISFPLTAGKAYRFTADLWVEGDTAGNSILFDLVTDQAVQSLSWVYLQQESVYSSDNYSGVTSLGQNQWSYTNSGANNPRKLRIEGVLIANASNDATAQLKYEVLLGGGTVTIMAGSFVRFTEF